MKLPGFNKPSKSEPPEPEVSYHYSLRITPQYIQAAIWVKQEDSYQILSLSSSWQWTPGDLDSLVAQADQALGESSATVNEDIGDPDEVLLGIPVSWTTNSQLLPEYKKVLRTLTDALDLKPIGFVVTAESIVNYLNAADGVVNGIVIGIEGQLIELAMVGQGIIHQTTVYDHHGALVEDITAAIHSLNNPHLPPKVYLYSGEVELTPIQRQLIEYDWMTAQVGFMHLPEIAIVANSIPMEAIIHSMVPHNVDQPEHPAATMASTSSADSQEESLPDLDTDSSEFSDQLPTTPAHLAAVGFIADEHIKQASATGQTLITEPKIGKDDSDDHHYQTSATLADDTPDDDITDQDEQDELKSDTSDKYIAPKSKSKKIKIPWKLILIVITVIAILGGIVYWLTSTTTATLTLYLTPQTLEKQFTVTVDPNAEQSQVDQGLIKGDVVTTTLSGTASAPATGSDTIGDKATGQITLFNDSDVTRSLNAGTVITAVDKDLSFTLDEDVQVASKSVNLAQNPPFSPGTATAGVTAAKIGPDYNVAAQTAFKVANFTTSTILARNEAAFAGGTSRQVKVVAKDDLTTADNQLIADLEGQAQQTLQSEIPAGQTLIDGSTFQEWQTKEYSHKAGEEADSVSITGELEIGAIVYDQTQLNNFAQSKLIDQVPSGKILSDDIQVSFKLIEVSDDGTYQFRVTTKSNLIPQLTREKIAKKVAGKSPTTVDAYLKSLPAVDDYTIEFSPNLPGWFNRFPFDYQKITVEIQ